MSDGSELELTQVTVDIAATYNLDARDLATSMGPGEVANLVIELDTEVGDWQTTCRLYHYFKGQFELAQRESPEDAALTVEQLDDSLADLDVDFHLEKQAGRKPAATGPQ